MVKSCSFGLTEQILSLLAGKAGRLNRFVGDKVCIGSVAVVLRGLKSGDNNVLGSELDVGLFGGKAVSLRIREASHGRTSRLGGLHRILEEIEHIQREVFTRGDSKGFHYFFFILFYFVLKKFFLFYYKQII